MPPPSLPPNPSLPPEERAEAPQRVVLERLPGLVSRLLKAAGAMLALEEGGRLAPVGTSGTVEAGALLGFGRRTVEEGGALSGEAASAACLGVPILGPDGRPAGALCAVHPGARTWSEADREALAGLAELAEAEIAAHERLRAGEARFRALFHGVADAVILYALTEEGPGLIEEANDVAIRRYGYSREELLRMRPTELIDPGSVDLGALIARLRREGSLIAEVRHRTRGGRIIPVEAALHLTELTGQPAVLTVVRDISERKAAERERALLAAVVASSDDAIISKSLEGLITSWNASAERIFGYSAAEALGQPALMLIPPERHAEEHMILGRLRRGERIEHFETVRVARDGRRLYLSLSVSPIRDGAGRVVGASKVARDITQRMEAERALRESEARFRQLAEALPQIVHTFSADGLEPLYLNPRWHAYTGLPEDAPLSAAMRESIHPDDLEAAHASWMGAIAEGGAFELEVRLRRHDGAYRWFITRVVPVHDEEGRPVRWFGTSTDIHAHKEAEAELEARVAERTAELERSNRELDQFAYVASHDLKAPLRAIDNLSAWILEDALEALPEASQRHLETLRGRVHRMERLLDDLLAYSRAGRDMGGREEIDPAELVADVAEMLDLPEGFAVEVEEGLPHLVSPRAPLEMIFRNLIANAAKHHDRPGGLVRVSAAPAPKPGYLAFSVADDGPGIEPEYHARIFGLFQTLRPRDEVEGSGMGLAAVKKAVEARGGSVEVRSEPGRGATFTFTWPRTAQPLP